MPLEGDRPRAGSTVRPAWRGGDRRFPPARRRGLLLAACAFALAAGVLGLLVGRGGPEHELARRFAGAWERADYPAMYRETTRRVPLAAFAAAYRRARQTATATRLDAGRPRRHGHEVVVPVSVATRIFGVVRETLRLPIAGSGDEARIAWVPGLVFPGLRPGERLERHTRMPPRAAILARDGTPLAQGAGRTSRIEDVAAEVVGRLGPIPPEQRDALRALGYPDDAQVGATGLERILEARVAGRPGGVLVAARARARRMLGSGLPRPARAVRTAVSPGLEREATAALGGRLGGVVAIRPRTGEILAFAGIAFSGLQPPGSTFKLITLTGVLEQGLATPVSTFPYATYATLSGVRLANANGETCGGTLAQALAISCNSVFAPLGARLGAARLVDVAQRFGFNSPPGIVGASTSTLPPADEIGDDLAVGSTAIGQGRVLASTLQMATVAAAIALRGRRPRLTVLATPAAAPTTRVTTERVARTVERLMEGVVRSGTGTAARIPGVRVAGKTGTAELGTTQHRCVPTPPPSPSAPPAGESCQTPAADDPTDTDAWFVAYAPAGRGDPSICVGVMLVRSGAGGDTAAPVARRVLAAALGATRPG